MELLKNIKAICKADGITIAQLERLAGLSTATVSKWGRIVPGVDKVAAVADFLGVSVDELLGRPSAQVSLEDRLVLDLLHQLNEEGRDAALAHLEFLATRPAYIKSDPAAAEEVAG